MKEEFVFFQSGPSSMPSTVRGSEYRTCHNFNKGFSCARTPCPYAHKCNKPGRGKITSGTGAPPPPNLISSHPHGMGIPTVSTIAPATAVSNLGGVVTPVNVFNLHCASKTTPTGNLLINCALSWEKGLGSATPVVDSFDITGAGQIFAICVKKLHPISNLAYWKLVMCK